MSRQTIATPDYTPHARAERLIAAGRLVLACSSLAAVYLEPSTPARYSAPTYTLLAVYVAYAVVLVVVAWRSPVPSRRMRLVSHGVDLVLFSVFILLTEGPASPFFLYFAFSLFCATLRFTWRGILATGIAAISIYSAMALAASLADPHFAVSRALTRVAYLGVIAAFLVYLGIHQQRLRAELASLAAWPRDLAAELDELLRVTLGHAASVLGAERVVLVWEEREEPWVYHASWHRGRLRLDRAAPDPNAAGASADLRGMSFFLRSGSRTTLVYDPRRSTAHEWSGKPVDDATRARHAIDSAIGVSFDTEAVLGQLLFPGVRSATADDLALAHIAGRLVLAALEQFFFLQQVRQSAGADERLRISRELHDGIVQSLGGVGLQLQAMRGELADESLAERLDRVQRVIEHDQRELRAIVRELRPQDPRSGDAIVEDELRRMRERFPLEWDLQVEASPSPVGVSPRLAQELCRIINESLSNAARHGGATHAVIELARANGAVTVSVTDNGRGFPFSGRYDLAALDRAGYGPRTLKERVAALGGSLTIESSPGGATVEATLPASPETHE